MPETKSAAPALTTASVSLKIIATAMVLACLYFASTLVVSLVCSIFIAFILEPGVRGMEQFRIPRWVGSLLMMVATLLAMYCVVYLVYTRVAVFLHHLPEFAERLKQIQVTVRNIRLSASSLFPTSPETTAQTVRLQQEEPWLEYAWRGLGSVYGYLTAVALIPILVFFMLTSKHQLWVATMNLFPIDRREHVENVINGLAEMVREYVLGNVLVGLASAGIICPVFAIIGLPYALLMGLLAAFLSLVPYLGVVLGLVPPLLVALVDPEYKSAFPFIVIAVTVVIVHFVALNILTPKLVGRRVKLNPVTVTVAMMFWGWMWGGIGLVLAVPITAAVKAICDNIESLRPYGAWLGEG
jgi:predicted PurR-regulated permease PerM